MKRLSLIFTFICATLFAQKEFPIIIKDSIRDVLIDDYENIYVYRNSDLSILKYDSLGHKKAQVMFPQPFKIQSVENPLNIFLFSENGQEIKILDQNLNEIQYLNLYQKFGHVKAVYSQDLQFIWVLDSARKQLIQYNYREDKIINIFPFDMDLSTVVDFIVYQNQLYLLREKCFSVYELKGAHKYSIDIENGKRLRRVNDKIYVIEKNTISLYTPAQLFYPVFSKENFIIVEKNSNQFLALIEDKLYLYGIEK